jgi:hypothetical protein
MHCVSGEAGRFRAGRGRGGEEGLSFHKVESDCENSDGK